MMEKPYLSSFSENLGFKAIKALLWISDFLSTY
jgi:hypothetical protein